MQKLEEMMPILKLCGIAFEIKISKKQAELLTDVTYDFVNRLYDGPFKQAKYARSLVSEEQWNRYELYYGADADLFQEVIIWNSARRELIDAFKKRPPTIKRIKDESGTTGSYARRPRDKDQPTDGCAQPARQDK